MQFGVAVGMIAADPTEGIKAGVTTKGEGFRAWGEDEIAAFRQHHALGTRARLALLLNTVQRRGDVIGMGPQHVRNGLLHVRQGKTGETLALPIMPELRAALDASPSGDLTFLTTSLEEPAEGKFTALTRSTFSPLRFSYSRRQGVAVQGLRIHCDRSAPAGDPARR